MRLTRGALRRKNDKRKAVHAAEDKMLKIVFISAHEKRTQVNRAPAGLSIVTMMRAAICSFSSVEPVFRMWIPSL